jgi:hypothetical protein
MANLHKDLHFTADFLSFLRAGFVAQAVFEGTMSTLGATSLPSNYGQEAHKVFDKLDGWLNDLTSGLPVFTLSWSTPDSFDAINAMGFLTELKNDLMWLSPIVSNALAVPDLVSEREAVKVIVAATLRSATARHSYYETFHSLLVELKAPELAQQAHAEMQVAKSALSNAQTIVDTFSVESGYHPGLCERLRLETIVVPGDLNALAHNARILLNVYAKQFSFDHAEIPREAARPWIDSGVPAFAAGYWHAYGLSADDFAQWASFGIQSAPVAASWIRARFTAQDALEWMRRGIPPLLAMQWRRYGFSAEVALTNLRQGITDPTKAPQRG